MGPDAVKPHLLYFPCRNALFDWFGESSGSGTPPVTVDLLAEQRQFESYPANRSKRVTCHGCAHPDARYVICLLHGQSTDKVYPRRYPNSQSAHKPGCYSYAEELFPRVADSSEAVTATTRASGEFAVLKHPMADPEYSIISMRRRNRGQADAAAATVGTASKHMTIGLQRLTKELLHRSGICEWHPGFAGKRNERVFNGRIKGAISDMMAGGGPTSAVFQNLPGASFVPWSFLDPNEEKTPHGMTACVGFGFVEGLGAENEHGARRLTLRNYPECPVVIPRRILDREGNNPRSALLSHLAHPTWAIFVAAQYDGLWKSHAMVSLRVSDNALIPVESQHENLMAEWLAAEGRAFRRWLLPPPEVKGRKIVPDFQLLDTQAKEYVEVGGLLARPDYAEDIRQKKSIFGPSLLVWDPTRVPLGSFVLPPRTRP